MLNRGGRQTDFMRVLFVHQNFPGQYRHIAPALGQMPGNEVVALGMAERPQMPGIRYVRYGLKRTSTPGIHALAEDFEAKVIRAEAAARACLRLKAEGFAPDIIVAHPGWGETLLLKDVWPDAKQLSFIEFNYSAAGADVGFDPEFPLVGEDAHFKIRLKNAHNFLTFEHSDWLISPTHWQGAQVPATYRHKLSVIHDGIDTDLIKPNPRATISLNRDGVNLKPGDEVVTFVNRNLEPYRGYHMFMRALPEILRRRPRARVVLVGGNGVSYGSAPKDGRSYREMFLDEVKDRLDLSRVHFVGQIPYPIFLNLLQVSAAHVYLTYPFVLSWSLLEAMAAGCAVIGSRTQPVEEVLRHRENGVLVDFFSPQEIADATVDALARPHAHRDLRAAARRSAKAYDLKRVCLPQHIQLIEAVAAGRAPSVTRG
ncbi:D-inositol-3-phosphate glycosyltransferase [Methylobacterium hispanicum]|uniref:D-inositol-3-phosphate glycosyltransferase n=2 Tax=Methylobacteriaceae TaxID=119045 RepID=A0AAV4ZYF9_9HYPH|nr:D-inositol-3-phosphate glycosyltransferase [Methylobacterium hispanicum]